MVFIDKDGKINENTYIFDGKYMNIPHFISIYIIENDGEKLMIDSPQGSYVRKFLKNLQDFGFIKYY